LLVTGGAKQGTSIELGASPITVGRLPENTLVLEDDYVSGRHARLYPHEGAWVVEDLGSTNGTYLDRTRLTSPMVLPVGTPVRIGKTVVELRK
jgi:pSer/pThr/pTyr-binding forkhead associated (FHA) protein